VRLFETGLTRFVFHPGQLQKFRTVGSRVPRDRTSQSQRARGTRAPTVPDKVLQLPYPVRNARLRAVPSSIPRSFLSLERSRQNRAWILLPLALSSRIAILSRSEGWSVRPCHVRLRKSSRWSKFSGPGEIGPCFFERYSYRSLSSSSSVTFAAPLMMPQYFVMSRTGRRLDCFGFVSLVLARAFFIHRGLSLMTDIISKRHRKVPIEEVAA